MQQPVMTVLITGASSGIGNVTAQLFASAGYRFFGTSRRRRPDEGDVKMLELDVRSDESVKNCVAKVLAQAVRETMRNAARHGDDPGKVAQVILKIVRAPSPRLRYLAGQERWLPYAKVLLPQRLLEYAVRRGFGLCANTAECMADPADGQ